MGKPKFIYSFVKQGFSMRVPKGGTVIDRNPFSDISSFKADMF